MSKSFIKPDLGHLSDFAQLEMVGVVSEIEAGQRVIWRSSGKQIFIHHTYPKIEMDTDGNIISSVGGGNTWYKNVVPDFDMTPKGIEFHRTDDSALCMLESAAYDEVEQLAQGPNASFEIFALSSLGEPLAVAWPTFNEEHPLDLTFANPMERVLPSFQLSIHLSVPVDFANRWRKS